MPVWPRVTVKWQPQLCWVNFSWEHTQHYHLKEKRVSWCTAPCSQCKESWEGKTENILFASWRKRSTCKGNKCSRHYVSKSHRAPLPGLQSRTALSSSKRWGWLLPGGMSLCSCCHTNCRAAQPCGLLVGFQSSYWVAAGFVSLQNPLAALLFCALCVSHLVSWYCFMLR